MSCLLAMMIPTELVTFIAHAPTSETDDAFFSLSAFSISRFGIGSHRYQIQRELTRDLDLDFSAKCWEEEEDDEIWRRRRDSVYGIFFVH